jgi:HEAT repeat protein
LARGWPPEHEIAFAIAVALGALASALLLLVAIAAVRHVRRWRAERIARAEGAWREALNEASEDPHAATLAPIGRLEIAAFLVLWNHFQDSMKAEASERLGIFLALHGIDKQVLRLVRKRSLRLKLIGITAAGHLREQRAWQYLEHLALHGGSVESFAAARALLRIEPRRALEVLGPAFSAREDWSLARLGSIFEELGPHVVTGPMVTMLLKRPKKGLNRLVKLARFGHRDRIATIVRGWLGSSDEMEVLIAGLDYVEDDSDLPWANGAARHEEWRVRMAAAKALGRIGGRGELAVLLELLRDPIWWVRYHAAQALTHLRGLEPHELDTLRENARDAFAADMLSQALAERRWQPVRLA